MMTLFIEKVPIFNRCNSRPVVPGCAGCAMALAHPDFGISVNPISTRGDKLCPPNYYWHTRIFRPSDGLGFKIVIIKAGLGWMGFLYNDLKSINTMCYIYN